MRFRAVHIPSSQTAWGRAADAICKIVGVSRRTLYRLFETEGGVLHYIQSRRLERIRSILANPSDTRRISEIAAEFGFLRGDHFARVFKQQFGQSARDLRQSVKSDGPLDAGPVVGTPHAGFDDWIRQLPS